MRSRRSGVSCIAYHGQVYVIGGFNGISRMCSGEKFNPMTNTWAPIPDMYNPRSNFAIEVIDDMIFAIGGFNGKYFFIFRFKVEGDPIRGSGFDLHAVCERWIFLYFNGFGNRQNCRNAPTKIKYYLVYISCRRNHWSVLFLNETGNAVTVNGALYPKRLTDYFFLLNQWLEIVVSTGWGCMSQARDRFTSPQIKFLDRVISETT